MSDTEKQLAWECVHATFGDTEWTARIRASGLVEGRTRGLVFELHPVITRDGPRQYMGKPEVDAFVSNVADAEPKLAGYGQPQGCFEFHVPDEVSHWCTHATLKSAFEALDWVWRLGVERGWMSE